MTRRFAARIYLVSLALVGLFNLGYWLGARADEPNGIAVQLAVGAGLSTIGFLGNLWFAAGNAEAVASGKEQS